MRKTKEVLILGVDIHGKECADIIARNERFRLLGYVSQEPDSPETFAGYPVFSEDIALGRFPSAGLIPLHVWKSFRYRDRWETLIDPSAFISSTARIGKGCVIYPQCFIGADTVLGDGILMLSGSVVNHDCSVEARATLTSCVTLAGGVTVGSGAYLGQGCTVRQHLRIGQNSFVGMGAVVVRDVPENTTVIGNPARPLVKNQENN